MQDAPHHRLEQWLARRWDDVASVRVTGQGEADSGYSAETRMVDVQVTSATGGEQARRVVLRRQQPQRAIYPAQADLPGPDIHLQYRVMAALESHADVPVAPLVGYEPEPDVLGAPFFVMEFVEGQVPVESPPYTVEGFFTTASSEQRRRMIEGGLQAMAGIHAVDWRAAGLQWLHPDGEEPGTARQLDLWRRYADEELGDRRLPLLDDAFAWLEERVPRDPEVGLCWGDPRPGNIIWQDFGCAALTDFEAAHLGAPEQDLGWWLMFDRTMHPDGTRPEGDPDRPTQREGYARLTGREPVALDFHEVFAAARYAAIVVRVTNGWVEQDQLPADHAIWRDNPATACLADVLAEHG